MAVDLELSGKLIAVEGLDGSGKSTQIKLLYKWLLHQGLNVFFTEWNSSVLVKKATTKGKKRHLLTPTTFSLIHCADFADRYERQIEPLLKAGYLVLCDRYVYTAYARDVARGCEADWVRNLYQFARVPDMTVYFKTPLPVALDRILSARPKLKYFEAGMDLRLSRHVEESFKLFQGKIDEVYQSMVKPEGFTVMDGTLPIFDQQAKFRQMVSGSIELDTFKSHTLWRGY